jgi:uncharacterized membrane protein YdjX (TVP38/TMEM64 family)
MKPINMDRKTVIKAAISALFVIAAAGAVRFTPAKSWITAERIGMLVDQAGLWGPLAFMAIYALGVCLLVPGTVLAGIGAILFGPYWAFPCVWVAAMTGASASFLIGRTLGRGFAASLVGDRLRRYDDAIERNGFATVLYLRMVYCPFTIMNFGMGLTKVRFMDFLLGTGLGIIVGTFLFTFFVGTVKEVWATGNWGQIFSWKVALSVGLFVFSFFVPKIVERLRYRCGTRGAITGLTSP